MSFKSLAVKGSQAAPSRVAPVVPELPPDSEPESGPPPQAAPALIAGDLLGHMAIFEQMGGAVFQKLVSMLPGGELLPRTTDATLPGPPPLADPNSAAAPRNSMLGPIGGDVLSNDAEQAQPLQGGVPSPLQSLHKLTNMMQGFTLTTDGVVLTGPKLAAQAAATAADGGTPALMRSPADQMKRLLQAFQRGALSGADPSAPGTTELDSPAVLVAPQLLRQRWQKSPLFAEPEPAPTPGPPPRRAVGLPARGAPAGVTPGSLPFDLLDALLGLGTK